MRTKRTTWKTLKAGDAFSIPLADGRFGIGVVLNHGQEMYLGAYRVALNEPALPPDTNALGELWLVMWSMDEQFYHGKWQVIGRVDVPAYPRPKHVVHSKEGLVLCDFDRNVLRAADEDVDVAFFGFRKSISNVAFRKALHCIHGVEDPGYDHARLGVELARAREQRD
ncbi:Imm26 family immunity protein [Stenotrophomonas sp.]|uniref:Imm26 family immunity protein n=1 Tax=Stenotrophomonas sp. TaxID=69392 RepID=UPI00289B8116|nr:Imm26 family immunity protein [Stenotrophomonas sp.]